MTATVGKNGRRCGAMTQKGTPCRNSAMAGGRCWLHGGGKHADQANAEVENDPERVLQNNYDKGGPTRLEAAGGAPMGLPFQRELDPVVIDFADSGPDIDISDAEETPEEIEQDQVHDTRFAGEPEEPKLELAAATATDLTTPPDDPVQIDDEMVPEAFMAGEDRAEHAAHSDKKFHMSALRTGPVKETDDPGFSDRWELKSATGVTETGISAPFGAIFTDKKPLAFLMKKRVGLPLYVLLAVLISAILSAGGFFYGDGRKTRAAGNLDINAINVSTKIVENNHIGPLFVISGQILNGYDHTRSYIRISGRLFLKGNFSKTETVYCGNTLSGEELAQFGWDAISVRLARKSGDGNTNEKIAAGGTLPFMVVFSELPDNLKELDRYTVEVTGSGGP